MQYKCNTVEQNDKIFNGKEHEIWKKLANCDINNDKVDKYIFEFKEIPAELKNP